MEKTGALIVASLNVTGNNRDNEEIPVFLPMLDLDGTTVIKREIDTLRRAGIAPIVVLCGYQKEVLNNHLIHKGVIFCEDADYETHDFAATREVGLAFARGLCSRILVIPVQHPAFSADTVRRLSECECSTVPVCEGQEGAPVLYVFPQEEETENQNRQAGKELPDSYGVSQKEEMENAQELQRLEVEDRGIFLSLCGEDGPQRMRAYVSGLRNENALKVKTKVILTREQDFFGPGAYYLLQAIDETGSIHAAAAKMEMSYSKCWKMLNRMEQEMGFPFLSRSNGGKNGGSSRITQEGRLFMERYHAMVEDMKRISRNFFDIYFTDFQ